MTQMVQSRLLQSLYITKPPIRRKKRFVHTTQHYTRCGLWTHVPSWSTGLRVLSDQVVAGSQVCYGSKVIQMRAITRLNSGDLLLCHIFAVWNCPRTARIMWEMLAIVCIKWQLRRRVVVMVIHLFSSQVLWVAFDPVSKPRPTHPLAQLMHAVWIMMACYDPRPRGHFGIAWSVCLSVQWHSCLGYRHTAGCLQLSQRQPPEICGLQTCLIYGSNCHQWGAYHLAGPGGNTLFWTCALQW